MRRKQTRESREKEWERERELARHQDVVESAGTHRLVCMRVHYYVLILYREGTNVRTYVKFLARPRRAIIISVLINETHKRTRRGFPSLPLHPLFCWCAAAAATAVASAASAAPPPPPPPSTFSTPPTPCVCLGLFHFCGDALRILHFTNGPVISRDTRSFQSRGKEWLGIDVGQSAACFRWGCIRLLNELTLELPKWSKWLTFFFNILQSILDFS